MGDVIIAGFAGFLAGMALTIMVASLFIGGERHPIDDRRALRDRRDDQPE